MAKKTEVVASPVDYQKLVSEICGILQVEESSLVEAVRQHAQAAKRPMVAATIFLDPLLPEPKLSFIKNNGEVTYLEAEYVLNAAMDFVKGLKAQDAVKKKMEEESK